MIVKGWLVDVTVGGLVGGLVGAVAAVNFVIYTGIEQGYEASLVEVFEYSLIAGIVVVLILLAGPVAGVVTARRLRQKRARTNQVGANDRAGDGAAGDATDGTGRFNEGEGGREVGPIAEGGMEPGDPSAL